MSPPESEGLARARVTSRSPVLIAGLVVDRLLLFVWPAVFAWAYCLTGVSGGHGAMLVGHIAEGWQEVLEGGLPWLMLLVIVPAASCLVAWAMLLLAKRDRFRTLALMIVWSTFVVMFLWLLLLSEGPGFTLFTGKRLITALCAAAIHLGVRVLFKKRLST